jgi:hypothetical protein
LKDPGNVTQFTLLVANGTVAPLFLVVRKPFVSDFVLDETRVEFLNLTKKKSERRGEEAMLAFLEFQKQQKTFSPGDILISDNEAAFDTDLVTAFLKEMGVEKLNFPVGLGHLTDPCDNEFHAEEKRRYYRILGGLDISTMTLKTKLEAIHGAYFSIGDFSSIPGRYQWKSNNREFDAASLIASLEQLKKAAILLTAFMRSK